MRFVRVLQRGYRWIKHLSFGPGLAILIVVATTMQVIAFPGQAWLYVLPSLGLLLVIAVIALIVRSQNRRTVPAAPHATSDIE